jgi:predicted dehydrogenase
MSRRSHQTNRRQFLQASATASVGFWVAGGLQGKESASPNEQIQVACFGVGGKGDSDTNNASRHGKIFAVCDVDRTILDRAAKAYETNHKFTDYRELLDKLGDQIDAVTVSTPDHNHAVIAAKAMKMGKHCFCQKPLTHSVWEARRLAEIAREKGVATQMGNQFTAFNPMRKAAYQIRAGQIGNVHEVHVWTNRPVWPQGESRPEPKPVPEHLDWEAWIGPAPFRPYSDGYHPFKWRGWWDFGTGALGDMACHTCNLPFMALEMRDPVAIEAETTGHNNDSYPVRSKIKYEFPARGQRAAFTMFWYDGSNLPDSALFEGIQPDASGVLLIGDKGKLYAAGDYAEKEMKWLGDVKEMDVDYPKSPGHVKEWFNAMHDPKQPAMSNFADYAGPLTETILLGNLAVWKGGRVEWDAANLKATNDAALDQVVHRRYRDGHEV